MDPSFEILISEHHSCLNDPKDKRLSGISQLLRSSSWILPVAVLKEIKQSVQDLATLAPDLFFNAVILYYAKFVQSIEIENLADICTLIPQYLKVIEILKTFCKQSKKKINFEPFLRIIIDAIKNFLLYYESFDKTIQFLNILKQIEEDFAIDIFDFNKDYDFIDILLQKNMESEANLTKSVFAITKIKEIWGIWLFHTEGPWIARAWRRLKEENKETCDKISLKTSLFFSIYFKMIITQKWKKK